MDLDMYAGEGGVLIVIAKPAGMVVQPGRPATGAGRCGNGLLRIEADLFRGARRPVSVHRL